MNKSKRVYRILAKQISEMENFATIVNVGPGNASETRILTYLTH